jgi:hypothetical protein
MTLTYVHTYHAHPSSQVRDLMIKTILATDMMHHQAMVADHGSHPPPRSPCGDQCPVPTDRVALRALQVAELTHHAAGQAGTMRSVDVLRTFCHVADLGNTVVATDLSMDWSVFT